MKVLYMAVIVLTLLALSACLFMPIVSGEKENVRYRESYQPF